MIIPVDDYCTKICYHDEASLDKKVLMDRLYEDIIYISKFTGITDRLELFKLIPVYLILHPDAYYLNCRKMIDYRVTELDNFRYISTTLYDLYLDNLVHLLEYISYKTTTHEEVVTVRLNATKSELIEFGKTGIHHLSCDRNSEEFVFINLNDIEESQQEIVCKYVVSLGELKVSNFKKFLPDCVIHDVFLCFNESQFKEYYIKNINDSIINRIKHEIYPDV